MFICNHCPFVIHYKGVFATIFATAKKHGIGMVAINSNDADNYPDDSYEKMIDDSKNFGYEFEYLYDENQDVAKNYKASCTPDIFLFNGDRELVYRGQMDSSRPSNDKIVNGEDMLNALNLLGQNKEIPKDQMPSIGCNIKWKSGNEPSYFIPKKKS